MKKLSKVLSVICALVLVASLGVTAFAESIVEGGNDGVLSGSPVNGDVTVNIDAYDYAEKDYYVVIGLTNLEYTWNEGSQGVWNHTSMRYDSIVGDAWEGGTANAAPIKTFEVKNQSNASVWVTAGFVGNGSETGCSVAITVDGESAGTAKEIEKATPGDGGVNGTSTNKTFSVALTGSPADETILASGGQIGTITVTIASTNSTP